uniref:TIGR04141 family sporadically distributed protein n=1 Tax=Steinernema glaseri TaxID=37863 RepID=A0A1I8ACC1_9BILA
VDALCATLLKKELGRLQKIGRPWTSTVTTHYSRRREFDVHLGVNPEGTQVWIEVKQIDALIPQNVDFASLSGNDRIQGIWVADPAFGAQPEKMPLERFKTKVLPLLNSLADAYDLEISSSRRYLHCLTDSLFSGLRALALKIETGYLGGKCIEFIEQQIRIGHLRELELRGGKWPQSMEALLKSFLRSPTFRSLDLRKTDLTIDVEMLIHILERFLEGDLRIGTRLYGKQSEDVKDFRRTIFPGNTLPLLGRFPRPHRRFAMDYSAAIWSGPRQERLAFYFAGTDLSVHLSAPSVFYFRGEAQAMESVPVAFVDALCATLSKEDFRKLPQLGRPWSRTAVTHFIRRREFAVYLQVHPKGTEVWIHVNQIDRFEGFEDIARSLKMPMDRFRTKLLPVLTSLADVL